MRDRKAAEPDLPGGGRDRRQLERQFLGQHRAERKADRAASAIMMPGSFAALAAKPLPPMIAASPANAITSAIVRNSVGRSPSTGQASIEAQTGMV